jgi:NAD(P)-dependent dehydrogenase (short-subunit alcohol dehydrogenase family)
VEARADHARRIITECDRKLSRFKMAPSTSNDELAIAKISAWIAAYMATKHAVEGFTDSMQYELDPFGIRLKLVEPGVFKTQFGGNTAQADTAGFADYDESTNASTTNTS